MKEIVTYIVLIISVFIVIPKNHNVQYSVINGVTIENQVAMNSYNRGPWVPGSVQALGKVHLYCSKHEANNICNAAAGLTDTDGLQT